MATVLAQTPVWWRGVKITARQRAAFRWAEAKLQRKYPGTSLIPTQGSFVPGYGPSAGTHDKAGVCDFRVWHYNHDQRIYALRCLRDAGQAAFLRTAADGFPGEHFHVCDRVTTNMAVIARAQVADYDKGLNGLSSHKRDRNPYRPKPPVKWSWKLGKPVVD